MTQGSILPLGTGVGNVAILASLQRHLVDFQVVYQVPATDAEGGTPFDNAESC